MATAVSAESRYFQLYSRAGRLAWDPADIDLTPDVAHWPMLRRDDPVEQDAEQIRRRCSLFWEGEEPVTRTLGPILPAMPRAGPYPITPVEPLVGHVLEAARWFLSAAGLGEDDLDVGDLEDA